MQQSANNNVKLSAGATGRMNGRTKINGLDKASETDAYAQRARKRICTAVRTAATAIMAQAAPIGLRTSFRRWCEGVAACPELLEIHLHIHTIQ
jgi:hypothetical protein